MENWITFLMLNLVVALFWFLGTRDTIMFVSHTHKCQWLQRGLSLYTLDQFASVVSICFIKYLFSKLAIELSILQCLCFWWQVTSLRHSHACHKYRFRCSLLQLLQVFSGICFSFFNSGKFPSWYKWHFCFFKLLVTNYSILLVVTSTCVTRNQ